MAELIWKGKPEYAPDNALDKRELPDAVTDTGRLLVTTETINPGAEAPQSAPTESWHNRLILGDKHHVLPALLPEFARKINLIYIDPPFMTGRDFKHGAQLA